MKTEFIMSGRGTGKTTELIKRSVETGAHIVVGTEVRKDYVLYLAERLGHEDIPEVFVCSKVVGEKCDPNIDWNDLKKRGLLIDDFDSVLPVVFKSIPIYAITMSDDAMKFPVRKPIVHCKDCGYYHGDAKVQFCDRPGEDAVQRFPDDFCSRARKREEQYVQKRSI